MKKLAFLFVCLFTLNLTVWAGNDKPIQVEELPKAAQQFIKSHFSNQSVAMAKMETEFVQFVVLQKVLVVQVQMIVVKVALNGFMTLFQKP